MKIQLVAANPDCLHVRCVGSIGFSTQLRANDPLDAILVLDRFCPRLVLLGVEQVPTIDSMGIAWLIRWSNRIKASGGRLALYGVVPRVMEVLTVCKLEQVIPMFQSEDAARSSLAAVQEGSP